MGGLSSLGRSVGHAFSSGTKAVTSAVKKGYKNYLSKDFLLSPGRWMMAGSTYGLSELTNVGSWYSKQRWSTYSDIAIAAAIGAAAASSIGGAGAAASGTTGVGASGAGAGAGGTTTGVAPTAIVDTTAAGSGMSTGTMLGLGAIGTSVAGTAYQTIEAKKAAKQQAAAQARAEANAAAASRESEIMRKQALLASQKSMAARRATAGAIANKLKNTTTSLGDEEEKLGD